jgi:hypothetical protein
MGSKEREEKNAEQKGKRILITDLYTIFPITSYSPSDKLK